MAKKKQGADEDMVSPEKILNLEGVSIEQGDADSVRSDSYVSTYTNHVQLLITKWDVRLIFAELEPSLDITSSPKIVLKAGIVMSHVHFERMLDVMQKLWAKNKDSFSTP